MKYRSIFLTLVSSFYLASCNAYQKAELSPELDAEIARSGTNKIDLKSFFKESEYDSIKISPDGKYLAVLFPKDGIRGMAVLTSDLSRLISTHTFQDNLSISSVHWVNNERLLIYAGRKYGYLDGRLSGVKPYFVNFDGSLFRSFFEKEVASFELLSTLPNEPDFILMARYSWHERGHPVAVKVNVKTGKQTLVVQPPVKRGSLLSDREGNVNVAVEVDEDNDDKTNIYYRLENTGKWTKLSYPKTSKSGKVVPISLNKADASLYVTSSHETGRDAIYKLDLKSGKATLVSSDGKVDVLSVMEERDQLVAATYEPGYPEVEVIDKNSLVVKTYQALSANFPNQLVSGLSLTEDQRTGVFKVSSDRNPGDYYKIDVKANSISKLGSSRGWIKADDMAEMKPVTYKARDGLEISGYLSLPPKAAAKNLPAVILVHGGPHGIRDDWGFDPEVQFLASRGFAVFQINYRGSGGYGISFEEAGYKEWGRKMQDDLTDGTRWLIEQGIADARRICIYGASYGGYAALMGAVREPDLYRCAVTNAGVSDLTIQQTESDTSRVESGERYLKKVLGEDKEELKARSAAYNVDKIKIPIFIAAGEDDVRVPFTNAKRMREALDKAGKPYEWMSKKSEGHGFQQPANRFEFYLRLEKFLVKNTAAQP